MSDELLPCPFCGGEADEYEGDYGNGIYCMMCGAMVGEPIHLEYRTTKRVSIAEAIAAWNKRVKRYPESLAQRMIADGYEYELFELRKERDEIKAEIADKYLKLPLDAVGTPIHVGDRVYWYAVGYFDVIGIGEQVVLDKGDSRFVIVPPDVLEVV